MTVAGQQLIVNADSHNPPIKYGSGRLVYLDPPYNMGINDTAVDDRILDDDYRNKAREWIHQAVKLVMPNGYLVIALPPRLRFMYEEIVYKEHPHLRFENELIWAYNFGKYTRERFVPSHDTILVFKSGGPSFYWQAVAEQSERMRLNDPRTDWRGRTPGDVFFIPRLPPNSPEKAWMLSRTYTLRSSQPEELIRRLVKAYTLAGEVVLDMFGGSGTVPKICRDLGRVCISLDICEVYCKEANRRLKNVEWERGQYVKLRRLNKSPEQ